MLRLVWRFLLAVAAGAATVALAIGTAPPARAEPVDCASQTHFVATADELDAAIDCHNAGTAATTITFQTDVYYGPNVGVRPITQSTPGAELTIDGDGFAVVGQPQQGASNDLFDIAGSATVALVDMGIDGAAAANIRVRSGAGPVALYDLRVTNAFGDGIVIEGGLVGLWESRIANNGSVGVRVQRGQLNTGTSLFISNGLEGIAVLAGEVGIADSTVTANATGGIAAVAGEVEITNTTVTANDDEGVNVLGGSVTVRDSTVDNNERAGVIVDGGVALVSNSSVAANKAEGVLATGGNVIVSNSTVASNDLQGIANVAGSVEVISSVVLFNAESLGITANCAGEITDGGSNFSIFGRTCAGFGRFYGGLYALRDNGCGVPQQTVDGLGCIRTSTVDGDSSGTQAGRCTGVPTGIIDGSFAYGDLQFDQRGSGAGGIFDRTIGPGCDAGSYETDSLALCGSSSVDVRTPQELDDAINCYNGQSPPGDYYISVSGTIEYPAGTGAATITQDDPALSITISGFDSIVAGSDSTAYLFQVTGRGGVKFSDIRLAGSPEISIGLLSGAGDVEIDRSSISGARLDGVVMRDGSLTVSDSFFTDADQWGILTYGGQLKVKNTIFTGNLFAGINVAGGSGVVTNSSFVDNTNFGVYATGGSLLVSNSTIAANGVGGVNVYDSGDVVIANSTVSGNGSIGVTVASGSAKVVSSIIAANNIEAGAAGAVECGGSITDLGNNFASDGSCVGFELVRPSPGSLEGPADYGCDRPAGPYDLQRCAETVRLVATSSAADAGRCTDVPIGLDGTALVYGDLPADQRGTDGRFTFPRTIGTGCDAGAFESEANFVNVCTTNSWLVATADELDQAIVCYNNQMPAGDHTITLANSITYAPNLGSAEVTQTDPNVTLEIDGAGFTVGGSRVDDGRFPSSLFVIGGVGTVVLSDLIITEAPNDGVRLIGGRTIIKDSLLVLNDSYAIDVGGGAFLRLQDSSLVSNGQRGLGAGAGVIEVSNVVMEANTFGGIYVGAGARLSVDQTTITDGWIGIDVGDGRFDESFVTVTNSTIAGLEIGMILDDGTVSVSNTTIAGNSDAGVVVRDGNLALASSIVAGNDIDGGADGDCTGPISDGGFNFSSDGSCEGFEQLSADSLGPLRDNGCAQVVAYPGGPICAATRLLHPTSNAIDAGSCDPASTDQRGLDRFIGADCDSGATESSVDTPVAADIGGRLWLDLNNDGLRQSGEGPLVGWKVDLLRADGTAVVAGGVVTDASGYYDFGSLPADIYTVSMTPPSPGDYFTQVNVGNDSFDSDVPPSGDLVVVFDGEQPVRISAGVVDGVAGDANCDGVLNILDAFATAQYVVGLRPATDSCMPSTAQPTGQISLGAVIDVSVEQDATIQSAFRVSQCVVGIANSLCPAGQRELSNP